MKYSISFLFLLYIFLYFSFYHILFIFFCGSRLQNTCISVYFIVQYTSWFHLVSSRYYDIYQSSVFVVSFWFSFLESPAYFISFIVLEECVKSLFQIRYLFMMIIYVFIWILFIWCIFVRFILLFQCI